MHHDDIETKYPTFQLMGVGAMSYKDGSVSFLFKDKEVVDGWNNSVEKEIQEVLEEVNNIFQNERDSLMVSSMYNPFYTQGSPKFKTVDLYSALDIVKSYFNNKINDGTTGLNKFTDSLMIESETNEANYKDPFYNVTYSTEEDDNGNTTRYCVNMFITMIKGRDGSKKTLWIKGVLEN